MDINNHIKVAMFALLAALTGCGGGGNSSSDAGSQLSVQVAVPSGPTWYSDAQPLIQRYCVACHVDGGVAPFPLETYDQVYGKRSAMVFVLESDTMPPVGYTDLKPAETSVLLQWLADGAPLGDPSEANNGSGFGFTYHADTRAIIEQQCVTCHVDGGVAPFPLDSYDKVRSVAAAASFSIENGTMPPWPPTEGYSRLAHARVLSAEDEFKLMTWLSGDLAEGNPADYVPPETEAAEAITYDVKIPLPQPYTPVLTADDPDDHRCFAMDWPFDEFTYVTATSVIPDQVAEVHHVIINIIEPTDVGPYLAASGQDGRPGWPCLLSGGLPGSPLPRQIGGWVPGVSNGGMPAGTGLGVEPGSLLVVQMHYNTLVAEPTPDQSTILIATTDEVERPANGFLYTDPNWLAPGGMPIPAGDPNVHHAFEVPAYFLGLIFGAPANVKATDDWAIHTGFLHMHNLGETGRVTLVRSNGTEQVIVDIRDWDFNWQSTYLLEQEVLVKPGDRLRLECTWDNSASNQIIVNGVQQEPKFVQWGDGTGDEMCLTNFFMTVPKDGYDYSYSPSVHIENPKYRQQFVAGDVVPLGLIFNNFSLHEPGGHGGADHDDGDHGGVYEGHYHIYLDSDDDSAEHLTAWDAKYFYQLPGDLPAGEHTLRVSLRGTDHHALGIEQSVIIDVVDASAVAAEQLIDVNDWTIQSAADDRFGSHRPADVNCPDNSWYNEDGALEVETGFCNYLSLAQPAKAALGKGDSVHLVLWHGDLAFEQPAQAHVAITIDGHTVWQENIEIPADANIYDVRIPVDFDAPAGSAVEFHLHNHGYNTWTLLQLGVER